MSTSGVNGANGAPKTAADFKPEDLQGAKEEKVRNTIFQLDEAIANDVEQIEADSTIDNAEVDRIYDWVHVIDKMIGNMSAQVQKSYSEGVQVLKSWVVDLIDMTGMGQYFGENIEYDGETVTIGNTAQASLEPEEKDADKPNDVADSHDTQSDIEDWIQNHFGAVPDVHKYDGVEGDYAIQDKIKKNEKDKLAGTHFTKQQIAEMGAEIQKARREEDKKFHKSQGLDI